MGRNQAAVPALATTPAAPHPCLSERSSAAPLELLREVSALGSAPTWCPGCSSGVGGWDEIPSALALQRRVCAVSPGQSAVLGRAPAGCLGSGSAALASCGLGRSSDLTPSLLLVLHSSEG